MLADAFPLLSHFLGLSALFSGALKAFFFGRITGFDTGGAPPLEAFCFLPFAFDCLGDGPFL